MKIQKISKWKNERKHEEGRKERKEIGAELAQLVAQVLYSQKLIVSQLDEKKKALRGK